MEFEIKNMGLTIAVGGLAFGGVYLALLLLNIKPFEMIPDATGHAPKFLFSAIGLAIVFGFGVLLEGVTQNVTAGHGNNTDIPGIEPCFAALVDSDKSLRFKVFFEITNLPPLKQDGQQSNQVYGLKYQAVGEDLIQEATNDSLIFGYVSRLKKCVETCTNGDGYYLILGKDKYDASVESVNNIFYKAKNLVYQNDDYFSELGAIETRKNFMLALLFDFMLLTIAHLFLGGFYILRNEWKNETAGLIKDLIQNQGRNICDKLNLTLLIIVRRARIYLALTERRAFYIGMLLTYCAMFYCALLAYRVESQSYNSRVLGYCATILAHENEFTDSKSKTGDAQRRMF